VAGAKDPRVLCDGCFGLQSLPADLKTLTTQTLIRTYFRLGSDLQESFMGVARGPAKFQVFAEATMEKFPAILLEWSDKLSTHQKDALVAMQRELSAKSTELALAESREKAEKDMRLQEKVVYEKTLQDQTRISALEIEHLKTLVRPLLSLSPPCHRWEG
jgi:hypothetical protein